MIELVKRYARKDYSALIYPTYDDENKTYAIVVILYIKQKTFSIFYNFDTKDKMVETLVSLDNNEGRNNFFSMIEKQIYNSNKQPDNETTKQERDIREN